MSEFTKKVRAAATAGWWTLLITYLVFILQWLLYLLVMAKHPARILCLLGNGLTWSEVQPIWLSAMIRFKLGAGIMLFTVIWLTFWARQLDRTDRK